MYLNSLATAVPEHRFSQRDCWEILKDSPIAGRLHGRSVTLLQKVLTGDNGISHRHFVTRDIERVFDHAADDLHATFQREGPRLAGRALRQALDGASLRAGDLDALFVCTCTGYLCPGLSSYVAEALELNPGVFLHDTVGMGCGAAIPMLGAASHFLAARPEARVAVVAVEICSAAFYLDDDPGVLISACLFSDGAAASIWSGSPPPDSFTWRAHAFESLHIPEDRELLRFEIKNGKLRNKLAKTVPEKAADAVAKLFPDDNGHAPVENVLAHPGGRDVLAAIRTRLPAYELKESRDVLHDHGNMSSPSILFVLEAAGMPQNGAGDAWMTSFGAGFSCYGCRLTPAG